MLYPGYKITIDGEDFIVPALSLGQLRNGTFEKLREHDKILADGTFFDAIGLRGEVILQALRRNYPDFSENKLMDYLDMSNIQTIWMAVLGQSGFTPGETKAAASGT